VILPREGVHHYGPNGEIVEYAPVNDGDATARAEKAEADCSQERVWRQQYMELADKLEQQRDKAQDDCAVMRSELAEARRQVEELALVCACNVLVVGGMNRAWTAAHWREWSANEARKGLTP